MKKLLPFLLILLFLNSPAIRANAAELNPKPTDVPVAGDAIGDSSTEDNVMEDSSVENGSVEDSFEEDSSTENSSVEDAAMENNQVKDNSADNDLVEQNKDSGKIIDDLKWNPDKPGSLSFHKKATNGTSFYVEVFKDGEIRIGYFSGTFKEETTVEVDLSHMIYESGDYVFRVYIYSGSDYNNAESISDNSEVFHYVLPDQKVEAPGNVKWDPSNPGLVTWDFVDHAKTYLVEISKDDFNSVVLRGSKEYSIPQEDFSELMEPGTSYKARVKAYSDNINLYTHSDFAESLPSPGNSSQDDKQDVISGGGSEAEYNPNTDDKEEPALYVWVPVTEEEKIRYSCVGKEKVAYTLADGSPFDMNIQNAMQGTKCFEVFQNTAGDYTIARTYNIYPLNSESQYSTKEKITISLTIPESLRKEKREFRMICVTQDGIPVILKDIDKDPNTITFSTDKFYAYALIYKDIK